MFHREPAPRNHYYKACCIPPRLAPGNLSPLPNCPFGMNHDGPWYATVAPENRYLYNGKEFSEDYDIKLMDYGARWYDGAIGRWTSVDLLAEQTPSWSAFNYVHGNPVRLIDPIGSSDGIIDGTELTIPFGVSSGRSFWFSYFSGLGSTIGAYNDGMGTDTSKWINVRRNGILFRLVPVKITKAE